MATAHFTGLVAILSLSTAASASISYVSQTRSVRSNATVTGQFQDDEWNAPAFAPFSAIAFSSATNATQSTTGRAEQVSTLSTDRIDFDGSVGGAIGVVNGTQGESYAECQLDVTFDLSAGGRAVRLSGLLSQVTHDQTFESIIHLRGPGGDVINLFHETDTVVPIDLTADLPDGRYMLSLLLFTEINRFSPAPSGTLDFSIQVIPAPGASVLMGLAGFAATRRRR